MSETRDRARGIAFLAAGIAGVVLGVLLFGLTTPAGAIDWISVVTAVAGVSLVVEGAYMTFRGTTHR